MDDFYDEITAPETKPDFEPVYNKHYITTDAQGRVTAAWSDGPHPDRDTSDAICINEQGGYQFRLAYCSGYDYPERKDITIISPENPPLYTLDGVPLYRWDGEVAIWRTEEELDIDRLPGLKAGKLAQLSAACSVAITAGCDVSLSNCAGHIALTAEDQINLSTAMTAVEQGAAGYPYHLDGQLCALYPASDIDAMARAATAHKLYHTTYYNHLAAWVKRCETAAEVQAITYGVELPQDLKANMAAVLAAAGGDADVV